MTEALAICLACGMFAAGFYVGVRMSVLALKKHPELAEKIVNTNLAGVAEAPATSESFPVARTDRRPTWRERRKQLEAAARKERERIEAWRG